MQVYRDLSIRGEPEKLDAVVDDICRSLTDGWIRDTDAEGYLPALPSGARRVYCFVSPKRPRRSPATVMLLQQDPRTLTLANIVPHQAHALSRGEYNSIAEDFFRRYAEPAAIRHGARAEMTEPVADLDRWLTPEAAEKLRIFCSLANRRTGSSHPLDRARWYDFLVAAHEAEVDESGFSASTLARWLAEEAGWDEAMAEKLAAEYEFARGLLAFAHEQKVGA